MAAQYNLKSVILGIEAVRGTSPAATAFYKLPISGEIGLHVESNSGSNNLLGDTRLANEEYLTTRTVSGNIPISADYSNIYFPLALAMGVPLAATPAGLLYTRVFTPQNCVPTASVQRTISPLCGAGADFVELFKGVAIDGWSINIQDEKLQVPMVAKGGTVTDSNDGGFTPITVASAKTLTDIDIRKTHSVLTMGGSSYRLSSQFSLQIGNNVKEEWYIGDGDFPSGLDFGFFTMSGSIAGVFDAAFLSTAKNSGRVDFEIVYTSTVDPLTNLTLTLTNVFIKYKTDPFKVGEKATLSFDWVADVHSTVSVSLTNKVAVY